MGFSNKIQKYFTNLFISIIEEDGSYKVFSRVVKNGNVKDRFDKTFEIKSNDEKLSKEMEDYIVSLQDKYNYVYITVLLNSMGQGAIKGTSDEDFEKASVDSKSVKTIKFKTWSAYVSFIDISWVQKIYSNIGVDLIYSPFVVLYNLLSNYKLRNNPTLYILNQEGSVTIGIFKGATLLFGAFYKINKDDILANSIDVDDWESEEEESSVEDLASLDNSKDEEEEFANLDDLSQLDILDGSFDDEEFSDIKEERDAKVLPDSQMEDMSIEDIELYGRDLEIYKFLNKALREYYKNEIYESDFLEQTVIFDTYDMSQEMMESIENDLLLDLQMHKVDISEIVCDLSVKEIYNEL
ncbi:MAG: hypothetical protein QM482_10110 [Sulfurospirillum sp.]